MKTQVKIILNYEDYRSLEGKSVEVINGIRRLTVNYNGEEYIVFMHDSNTVYLCKEVEEC